MVAHESIPESDEVIGREIIGAAIEVHRELGPGFLESIYQQAMIHEMRLRQIGVEQEKPIVVTYKELKIPGQRLDLLVGNRVIVELKCVSEFAPIHQAQILSYLKATNLRLGYLINFNTELVKNGIKRVVR